MTKTIAIVDDDEIFRFTTKVKLLKLGLAEDVLMFNDGEEIFQYLQETSLDKLPHIVLLDINMPIVDGWDFLKLYRSIDKAKQNVMSLYMLSSSINPDDVKRAEDNVYVQDYITKPVKDDDMKKIFESVHQ